MKKKYGCRRRFTRTAKWYSLWQKMILKQSMRAPISGTVWAFVQPIVTICVYWFVFGLALRSGSDKGVPFVLWLIAGLVPWFFLQEGLTGGTNALLEYNYLVKK